MHVNTTFAYFANQTTISDCPAEARRWCMTKVADGGDALMKEAKRSERISFTIILCAFAVVGLALCVFGYQCIEWLRNGEWPTMLTRDWLGDGYRTSWVGIDRIIGWVMGAPLAGFLFVTGICVGLVGDAWDRLTEEKYREVRRIETQRKWQAHQEVFQKEAARAARKRENAKLREGKRNNLSDP
jgi:hypothetical protein